MARPGQSPVRQPLRQEMGKPLGLRMRDNLQASWPDLAAYRPWLLSVRWRCPDHIARLAHNLGAEAFTGFYASLPTTEMLATLHGGGHHALRILAAAASSSWIESTNSKNTSRGDANIGSCCCSIASSSPITRRTRALTSRVTAWRSTGTRGTAHHDRPPGEKADAPKPPATLRSPAVDSASKSLTTAVVAAEISAALPMLHHGWR